MSDRELDRVASALADPIEKFCNDRPGELFFMADLREYLISNGFSFAPDSPSRILRELRLQGKINYKVKNRAKSLYEIIV